MFLDDSKFIDEVLTIKTLKDEYLREKRILFREIDKKHRDEHDELVRVKLRGIDEDKKHRMTLNMCIFPFVNEGELTKYGYQFARASPLSEKKVPNFDFLILHSKDPVVAMFGEAKGSVGDPGLVVDQTKDRIKSVQEHSNYIKENYFKNASSEIEYVIGVNWPDAHEMMKSVFRKGGGIIVWSCGAVSAVDGKQNELLELMAPLSEDGPAGKSMLHKDRNLNRDLHKIRTSAEFKDFFIESHPFAKLVLMNNLGIKGSGGTFTFNDLLGAVKEVLDYLDDATVRSETELIISYAKDKIKFIEELEHEPGRYKFASRKKIADREAELKRRWVDYEIEQDKIESKVETLRSLQEKYQDKRKQFRNIDDFR